MKKYIAFDIQWLVLCTIVLIFCFITFEGATEVAVDPVIWYLNGAPVIYSFGVLLIGVILLLITHSTQIITDGNLGSLIVRCIVCLIPLLYISDTSSFSSHYPVVIFTVLAYFLGLNVKYQNIGKYPSVYILFSIILCIQVYLTFKLIDTTYFDLQYKYFMRIPIAASNVIATFLSPIMWLLIFNFDIKKSYKIIIGALLVIGIILTKSRGGITGLFLTYLVYLTMIKIKTSPIKIFFVLTIVIVLIQLLMMIPEVSLFFKGYTADSTTADATELSSGRLTLFQKEIDRALERPIFGNGMVYNQSTTAFGSHNFIIELFVQSGLVGTILYIAPMYSILRKSYNRLTDPQSIGWFLFCIGTIIHGLEEVNFFNFSTDIIFWFAMGIISNTTRHKIQNESITSKQRL